MKSSSIVRALGLGVFLILVILVVRDSPGESVPRSMQLGAEAWLEHFGTSIATMDGFKLKADYDIWIAVEEGRRHGYGTFEYSKQGQVFRIASSSERSLGFADDFVLAFDGDFQQLFESAARVWDSDEERFIRQERR